MTPRRLPIVWINGRAYFEDDRLREYRAVDDPGERISFEVVEFANLCWSMRRRRGT
jgi:hypothetical protein